MEVGDDAGLLGPLRRLGHGGVTGLDEVRQYDDGGHPGGHGATGRSLLDHGGQALGQSVPAHGVERVEHVGPGLFALAFEEHGEFAQRIVIGRGESGRETRGVGHHLVEPLDLDVEVAHGAQDAGEPAQLFSEGLGPHGQHVREEGEGGAEAPGGHAHVVELLDVLAEPGPRFLLAQHGELAPQHRVGELADRRLLVDRGRTQIG